MSQWQAAMGESGKARNNLALQSLDDPEAQDTEGESWLISYLDTLTLLLTMFVVLLTFADFTDEETPEAVKVVPKPEVIPQPPIESEQEPVEEAVTPLGGVLLDGLDDSVQVQVEKDRVNLVISDRILFDVAEAELRPEGLATLDPLIPILKNEPHRITVEGHTDNLPITTDQFPSNWELAAARAASVVRYLQRQGIASDRLRAVGYADTRPLAENDSPEGRSANRRVEIVIHHKSGQTVQDLQIE
ncbi:MAG: OmpA family protein [Thiohalophilus sp.]|uniref:OmpA/MotB family protein n=1 Tax=Thiohalophilus sp. TaxID=3028392 RepID=UPI0028701A11|nr:OmpA family protein [Thiohalophilus sp.]MDR9435562.1 OmpA family protein [Thiohalophilus sp.]